MWFEGGPELNLASTRPGWDKEYGAQRLEEVLKGKRKLMQADDDTREDGSGFECRLTTKQRTEYLNTSTRTWLIDDDALEDLSNDLQAVVNCTEEGDLVLLDISRTITPASRLVVPWRLTITGAVDDADLTDGVFPSAPNKTIVTCPDENESVFLIRAEDILIANVLFTGCSFDASDEPRGIIEVQTCESEGANDVVRLHHVDFTDNRLIGGVGLLMNSPSCYATELIDVKFRGNDCNGFCGAMLSSENTLRDVVIERNIHVEDGDNIPPILSAPEGSVTTAQNISAEKNQGSVIFMNNGTLSLTHSSFTENSANVTGEEEPFGSCLRAIDSLVDIRDCEFIDNTADLGGVMYLRGSIVDVKDCSFEDNAANNGAVFYAREESQIMINASVFSGNVAEADGGIVHADDSVVTVTNSTLDRNMADRGGCFWFTHLGTLNLTSSNFTLNEAAFGGVAFLLNEGLCMMHECVFSKNRVKNKGGVLHLEKSNSTINACLAIGGKATSGGVFSSSDSTMLISNSRCEENTATYGGCLQATRSSTIEMSNVQISSNIATEQGGGIYVEGDSSVTVRRSRFVSNLATDSGGAIYGNNGSIIAVSDAYFERNKGEFGGAILLRSKGNFSLSLSLFQDNEAAASGGACYIQQATVKIEDCQFHNGRAASGGFILTHESRAIMSNVTFTNATTASEGGCLVISDGFFTMENVSFASCTSISGGAVAAKNSQIVLRSCMLSSNSGGRGGGIYGSESNMSFETTVFKDGHSIQGAGISSEANSTIELNDCHFFRNKADVIGGGLQIRGSTFKVKKCSFSENTAKVTGGAVFLQAASGTMTACEFHNNSASSGGAMSVAFQSSLELNASKCINNAANSGGCLECLNGSRLEIQDTLMEKNKATEAGGAVTALIQCEVILLNCTFQSNGAMKNGGAVNIRASVFEGRDLNIVDSSAKGNGGGIYCDNSAMFSLSESNITGNSGQWGGGMVVLNVQQCAFRRLKISKNSASRTGGGAYLENITTTLEEVEWLENRGSYGGSLDVRSSFVNITTSTFGESSAEGEGGAVYVATNSTIRMVSVSIKHASAAKGGGALSLIDSELIATDLNASHCRSDENGGSILMVAASTLLCINCTLEHSIASGRGGAVSIESNQAQSIAAQFQGSAILNNSAEFGGGLHFISPYQDIDCSMEGEKCTIVALTDTRFEKNTASTAGGAIFTTELGTIRLDCSEEKSVRIKSEKDLCSSWKDNSGGSYGDNVATYAARVKTTIFEKTDSITLDSRAEPYVIQNHASGSFLPDIELIVLDAFGQGPTIGVKNDTVNAFMASDDFLHGGIAEQLTGGFGNFTKVIGFQQPDVYDIVIQFSEDPLPPLHFKVEIRNCSIGEAAIFNRLMCEKCIATKYSFDPTGSAPCLPCPENANCTFSTIQPEEGYWHAFPCSEHVQRCLTKRACDYKGRDNELAKYGNNEEKNDVESCDFDEEILEKYRAALCNQGHKGPLCGSCDENYGKSQSFNCRQCFSGFSNIALVLLSILTLICLAGFTARGNLVSFAKKDLQTRAANNGVPESSSGQTAERDGLEQMERCYLGKASTDAEGSPKVKAVNLRECAVRKAKLAKWKAVELFKITINFVQVTAIAVAINVDWGSLLVGLFETAEFVGGVTSEATNRSVDCLVPEDSSVPRSVVSTIVDLLVPVSVVFFFVVFWGAKTQKTNESFGYFFKRSVLSTLAVFYIAYISITKTLVNILSCVEVHDSTTVNEDSTSSYWAVDTSLRCYEGSHEVLAGAAGWPLLSLFSLIFPIAVAITILRNVKQDYEQGWIYDVAGFMYRSYRSNCIFWESAIMLRKAALAVVVVFAYPLESSMQLVLAIFVLTLSLYFQTVCRPYRKEFDSLNNLESTSLLVSLLTFVSSLCFDNDRVSFGVRVAIAVAVFLGNVCLFLFFVTLFFIFSAEHLKAVLDIDSVRYRADGGTLHILRIYFTVHLRGMILEAFGRCFKCLIGPRSSDENAV